MSLCSLFLVYLFLWSLLGSVLCGVSNGIWMLIISRLVQGVGGGSMFSLAMIIIGDIVPSEEQGNYQALLSAVGGAAMALGPLIGGCFVEYSSWRWIFYVSFCFIFQQTRASLIIH